jgi:hypothetical protein
MNDTNRSTIQIPLFMMLLFASCASNGPKQGPGSASFRKGQFGYDLAFLQERDTTLILLKSGDARLIVSPKYQAKVFTSTAEGDTGTSFGWVHYNAFDGPPDPHMNAYGGENRLWLGPEGGKFSLFFSPGAPMVFENWKTPAGFDTEPWELVGKNDSTVSLRKDAELVNYRGTPLSLTIDRGIRLLNSQQIIDSIGFFPDASVKMIGYETLNTLTNKGATAWTETTGMPCIWILDMFNPSDSTTIVIPYKGDTGKPATTDYFGEIPPDRIKYGNGTLFFKADGKSRGKLGIHPGRAENIAGSYDALKKILTIIVYTVDNQAKYLNQEWLTTKPPFSGDAVNAYNDGPLANGSQMGPFYELESVSPAALLMPGQSLVHHHSVFHFTGPETGLNSIAQRLLSTSLQQIKNSLK